MYPLLATFIRYVLIAISGHLAAKGYFDASLSEAIAGAGVAAFAIVWFLVTREKPPQNDDPDYGGAL